VRCRRFRIAWFIAKTITSQRRYKPGIRWQGYKGIGKVLAVSWQYCCGIAWGGYSAAGTKKAAPRQVPRYSNPKMQYTCLSRRNLFFHVQERKKQIEPVYKKITHFTRIFIRKDRMFKLDKQIFLKKYDDLSIIFFRRLQICGDVDVCRRL
jgi:hypothetical protein